MNYITIISFGFAATLVLMVNASSVSAFPGHDHVHDHAHLDYYHEPNYAYGYGVNDYGTGDVKTAEETRHDGWTKGSYSVLQPDGILRTVNYIADPVHGFQATVHNEEWSQHPKEH